MRKQSFQISLIYPAVYTKDHFTLKNEGARYCMRAEVLTELLKQRRSSALQHLRQRKTSEQIEQV